MNEFRNANALAHPDESLGVLIALHLEERYYGGSTFCQKNGFRHSKRKMKQAGNGLPS